MLSWIDKLPAKVTSSGWISLPCPFCSTDFLHAKHYHLHIAPNMKYAHCFRCGWKGSLSELEIKIDLMNIQTEEGLQRIIKPAVEGRRTFPAAGLTYLIKRNALAYALSEGWVWNDELKAVGIPLRVLGVNGNWIFRRVKDNAKPKYLFKKGAPQVPLFYNYQITFRNKPIILVEGVFDCIAVRNAGWSNCIALCGKSITSNQILYLRYLNPPIIYLLLDSPSKDENIAAAVKDALEKLSKFSDIKILTLPWGDPADYKDLKSFLSERVKVLC